MSGEPEGAPGTNHIDMKVNCFKEQFRKGALYPLKLLKAFGPSGAIRFVAAYLQKKDLVAIKPRGFPHKVWMRPAASDIRVVYEIFVCRELEFNWPFAAAPARVIDAGANVGYATLAIKRRWPECKIIALEPDAANFEILARNCRDLTGVTLLKQGVWSENCHLRVEPESLEMGSWGLRFEPCKAEEPGAVNSIGIAELLDQYGWPSCDLLKMDVEGAEIPIFRRRENWLRRAKAVLVEPHGPEALALVQGAANGSMRVRQEGEKYLLWHI